MAARPSPQELEARAKQRAGSRRGELFIGPGVDVYEGMIIGEVSRSGEMTVNPTKGKELTNIRTHSSDEAM